MREAAEPLQHPLMHKESNPYCDACARGINTDVRRLKGNSKRNVSELGQIVTCDHAIGESFDMTCIHANRDAIIMHGVLSRLNN